MAETFINNYRQFGLCFALETDFGAKFDELKNDFGDGFESARLIGSDEGLRSWSLAYDNVNNFNEIYTLRGRNYGMADYLWNLFHYSTRTGEPFVILCPRTNQYYFARFAETSQSLKRKLANFYGASVNFIQRRIKGVSCFSIENCGAARDYQSEFYSDDYVDADTVAINWDSNFGGGLSVILGVEGSPTFQTNEQNNKPIVRLDGTDDYFANDTDLTVFEAFIVCKYRGEEFTNFAGLLSGIDNSSQAPLVGTDGAAVFYNYDYGDEIGFSYKFNGITYPQTNMVAPMDAFGLVHIRCEAGFAFDGLQLGKDRSFAGRLGSWDIGQVVICTSLLSEEMSVETAAHLMRIWGL